MKNDISVKTVDDILRKFFPSSCDKVAQAMEYSVFSGGKRIRPMLLLATAQAVGGSINDGAKTLAAALSISIRILLSTTICRVWITTT